MVRINAKNTASKIFHYILDHSLSRLDKIRYIVFVMTIGFVSAVFFHYLQGNVWMKPFPLNTFLPVAPTNPYGGDLFGAVDQWKTWRFAGVGYGLAYFPGTYLIVDLLHHLGPSYRALLISWMLFTVFMGVYAYANMHTEYSLESIQNTIVCAFTSYPFLFTFQTGNLEMYLFMFLVLFIYFYQQKRFTLSSACLAMSISMKLFPIVFLILFLSDRRYREALSALIWTAVLMLLPLLIFRGGIRDGFGQYIQHLKASQAMYANLMILNLAGLHYGHSLLGAIRIVFLESFPSMNSVLFPYLAFTVIIFSLLSLYIVFFETLFWKKVALLVIAMDLLPYTSTDYKLMHFYIPLFLFANIETGDRFDILYAVLFSLLLIPKDYCYFHGQPFFSLNSILNPLIMALLVSLICLSRLIPRHYHFVNYSNETLRG